MNLKLTATASAAALLLALGACGQSTTATTDASTPVTPEITQPAPIITASSPDFVTKVAISDMYETQASQIAVRRANNAQVRDFANTMARDHAATTARVQAIVAGRTDLPLPTTLDQQHQDMLTELTNASAADFDQKYIDQQTHAHEDASQLLMSYAQGGDNAELRAFANETAPKVQQHLTMVRALDQTGADEPPA
jgi:putative membrane protein